MTLPSCAPMASVWTRHCCVTVTMTVVTALTKTTASSMSVSTVSRAAAHSSVKISRSALRYVLFLILSICVNWLVWHNSEDVTCLLPGHHSAGVIQVSGWNKMGRRVWMWTSAPPHTPVLSVASTHTVASTASVLMALCRVLMTPPAANPHLVSLSPLHDLLRSVCYQSGYGSVFVSE